MEYQEAIKNHINECRHRVDVIRNHMNTNVDADTDKCLENIQVLETVIFAMNELQMYKDGKLCLIPESVYSKQCTELDAYKQIGTLEEVGEAMERKRAKKPKTKILCGDIEWWCPNCGESHIMMDSKKGFDFCHHCGQKLDWSE